jgi:hypothetical protein
MGIWNLVRKRVRAALLQSSMVGLVFGACLWASSSAKAAELRLGLKGTLTLQGLLGVEATEPSLAPWDESNVGLGGGGGIYAELHFNRLIALELDVLFQSNRLFFEKYQGSAYLEQAVVFQQLRIPLLFRLSGPIGKHVEFTGALGPEAIVGIGASPYSALYGVDRFAERYSADEQSGLALTAAFGFAFLTKHLHIPIELRFAYNLLGPYSYRDRVLRYANVYEVQAVENWQALLVLGFGFRIPPEQPPPPPRPVLQTVEVDDPFYYPPKPDN